MSDREEYPPLLSCTANDHLEETKVAISSVFDGDHHIVELSRL